MRFVILVGAVMLVVLFAYLRGKIRQRRQKSEFKSTEELVRWLANEGEKDAKFRDSVSLGYTVDSIERVDFALGKIPSCMPRSPQR